MTRVRRFLLFVFLVYLGIFAATVVELIRHDEVEHVIPMLVWPFVPMYYMLLLGLPMLVVYGLVIKSERLVVHVLLACASIIYLFLILTLLAAGNFSSTPVGTAGNIRITLKYGLISAAAIMLTFWIDRGLRVLRGRKKSSQQIKTFD